MEHSDLALNAIQTAHEFAEMLSCNEPGSWVEAEFFANQEATTSSLFIVSTTSKKLVSRISTNNHTKEMTSTSFQDFYDFEYFFLTWDKHTGHIDRFKEELRLKYSHWLA